MNNDVEGRQKFVQSALTASMATRVLIAARIWPSTKMHHMSVQLLMDSPRVDHSLGVCKRPIADRNDAIVRHRTISV